MLLCVTVFTSLIILLSLNYGQGADSEADLLTRLRSQLLQIPLAMIPLSVIISCFLSFFSASRLYTKRFTGYLTFTVLNWLMLAGLSTLIRLVLPTFRFELSLAGGSRLVGLFPGYIGYLSFYDAVQTESWLIMLLLLLAPAALIAACWPFVRLTKNRPLYGAFLGPPIVFGLVYLFSVYASDGVELLFNFINFIQPMHFRLAILAGASIPALYIFDLVFASPPAGIRAKRRISNA